MSTRDQFEKIKSKAKLSICSNTSEVSSPGFGSQSIAALTSGVESIQFGNQRDLEKEFKRERRATLTEAAINETFDSSVIFSDSDSEKHSESSRKGNDQGSGSAVGSMFVKPGEESSSDEETTDDVEEIPRTEIAELSDTDIEWDEDFVLFIKMTPYPLTLEELIVRITPEREC